MAVIQAEKAGRDEIKKKIAAENVIRHQQFVQAKVLHPQPPARLLLFVITYIQLRELYVLHVERDCNYTIAPFYLKLHAGVHALFVPRFSAKDRRLSIFATDFSIPPQRFILVKTSYGKPLGVEKLKPQPEKR
eukprot:1864367-Pyramimonas_sp.AAC.1